MRVYSYRPDGQAVPVEDDLAAFLALIGLCGPPELRNAGLDVQIDAWTLWAATGPDLKDVLKRVGETVTCPALGTAHPPPAA
jgi:hypothetical protein